MKFTACDRCHINTQGSDIKSVRLENTMRDLCPACLKLVREEAPAPRRKSGICESCGDSSINLVGGECVSCRN